LIVATQNPKAALGFCKGWRPWLGNNSREQCGGGDSGTLINRLLIRSASNAYFPQVLSVISIPEASAKVRKAVDEVWEDFLQYAESVDDVRKERKKAKVNLVGGLEPDVAAHLGYELPFGVRSNQVGGALAVPL
jgi:hypothetical protein